jgi:hypothetical protein
MTAQVLTAIPASAITANAEADIHSIMWYWLPAEIMADGVAVDGGTDIDTLDSQSASRLYPSVNPFPNWLELDNNPATVQIIADGNQLYQRHNTGRVWLYTS